MARKRLDILLQEKEPTYSRQQIQSFIMQGRVIVNGKVETKAGTLIAQDAVITYDFQEPKFVSRGGYKLEKALEDFKIAINNKIILDAGISTGGFTDCLLQHGAAKVYGIDVGYGQVAEKIRIDPRVIIKERTNIRHLSLTDIGELVDVVTLDLSFISVLKVLEAVKSVLKPQGDLIVLIKPQFEAQKEEVGKGGIIRDDNVRKKIVEKVVAGITNSGFIFRGLIESPIEGASGNKEYLGHFYFK